MSRKGNIDETYIFPLNYFLFLLLLRVRMTFRMVGEQYRGTVGVARRRRGGDEMRRARSALCSRERDGVSHSPTEFSVIDLATRGAFFNRRFPETSKSRLIRSRRSVTIDRLVKRVRGAGNPIMRLTEREIEQFFEQFSKTLGVVPDTRRRAGGGGESYRVSGPLGVSLAEPTSEMTSRHQLLKKSHRTAGRRTEYT